MANTPAAYAAVWYPTCSLGEVVAIEGVDDVQTHPAVMRMSLKIRPGECVPPIVSSAHRIGSVLIAGRTEALRDEAMLAVRERLRVVTR